MGPSAFREFRYAKIFKWLETLAEGSHAFGNLAAGFVEGVAGILIKRRIDGEGEEPVWLGVFSFDAELPDFDLGAVTAGPLAARKGDPNSASKL